MEQIPNVLVRNSLINAANNRREEAKGRNRGTVPIITVLRNHEDARRQQTHVAQNEEAKLEEMIHPEAEENSSDAESVLTLYLPQHDGSSGENNEGKSDDKSPDLYNLEYYTATMAEARAVTAPARPRTEIEKFRASSAFTCLENAAIHASQLIQRNDNKFDLDSNEGQKNCKKFLNQVEALCSCFKINCSSRKYRDKFSQAYKVLYKEGSLCYLTEILDSAQERTQWVLLII